MSLAFPLWIDTSVARFVDQEVMVALVKILTQLVEVAQVIVEQSCRCCCNVETARDEPSASGSKTPDA